jgi:hypothetical protein
MWHYLCCASLRTDRGQVRNHRRNNRMTRTPPPPLPQGQPRFPRRFQCDGRIGRYNFFVDINPILGLKARSSRSMQGRRPVTPAGGARAVPAGRGSSPPLPGGFGITPGRHYDRPAMRSLDWDWRGRVTPVLQFRPRKRVWSRTAALVRCRKSRGGTPVGLRAPLGARRTRMVRSLVLGLPAFRLPCLYLSVFFFLRSPGERSDTRGRQ